MKLVALFTVLAVAIVHVCFWTDISVLFSNTFFAIVDVILCVGTLTGAIVALIYSNEPEPDKWKYLMAILFAAATILWAGGWAADHRSRISEHIKGETIIYQKSTNV